MIELPGRVPGTTKFAPGNQIALGRKGSRNKLGETFLAALLKSFESVDKDGVQLGLRAIERARDEDPAAYVKVIASLLPKELTGEDGAALITGITVTFVRPEPVE